MSLFMPKLKTRRAAAKRFRSTGRGKIVRRRAFKSHLLEHKSPSKKRKLNQTTLVHETDDARVRGMIPTLKKQK